MAAAGGAAAGAGAAAAAIANAVKASGVLVRLEAGEMQKVLARMDRPAVVVVSHTGVFTKKNQYLTSWRGLAFYCKTTQELPLPSCAEVVAAKTIWMPS
jgi:ketopantoate hydroxymethyltransferase